MKAIFTRIFQPAICLAVIMVVISSNALAHEFWIEPLVPVGASDEPIVAKVKVGQNFNGGELYYTPSEVVEAKVTDASGATPLDRILGDYPIFKTPPRTEGLHILSYVSKPSTLTYKDDGKYQLFLKNQGLDWVLAEHKKRGLPLFGFKEAFSRYAKALIVRGSSAGSDKPLGLTYELVALTNPYESAPADLKSFKVQALFEGKPAANAQISIFEKTQTVTLHSTERTGADGIATIALIKNTRYMLSSVQMVANKPESGVVWESLWASLTFAVGE